MFADTSKSAAISPKCQSATQAIQSPWTNRPKPSILLMTSSIPNTCLSQPATWRRLMKISLTTSKHQITPIGPQLKRQSIIPGWWSVWSSTLYLQLLSLEEQCTGSGGRSELILTFTVWLITKFLMEDYLLWTDRLWVGSQHKLVMKWLYLFFLIERHQTTRMERQLVCWPFHETKKNGVNSLVLYSKF